MIDARSECPLRPALIEDETPSSDTAVARGGGNELFGVGERRHAVGADERGELEIRDSGRQQRLVDTELRVGCDGRFVLQAVAEGDVTNQHGQLSFCEPTTLMPR